MLNVVRMLNHHIYKITDEDQYADITAVVTYFYYPIGERPYGVAIDVELSCKQFGEIWDSILAQSINHAQQDGKALILKMLSTKISNNKPFKFNESSTGIIYNFWKDGILVDSLSQTHIPPYGFNTLRSSNGERKEKLNAKDTSDYIKSVETSL
jgi:hypothetical protein